MSIRFLPIAQQTQLFLTNSLQPYTQQFLVDNLFSLDISQKQTSTRIVMQMLYNQVNTREIPHIVELLNAYLPNVLKTQCFNDDGFPFSVEVKHTELGHLFEHILLEYLCQGKIAKGANRASYSGNTRWNWVKDPRGKFHIRLSCGKRDADILPEALEKTISLMKVVLAHHKSPLFINKNSYGPKNGLKNGSRLRLSKRLANKLKKML
jgi:hypothetical protein